MIVEADVKRCVWTVHGLVFGRAGSRLSWYLGVGGRPVMVRTPPVFPALHEPPARGMNPGLGACLDIALPDMIVLLGQKAGLSREDAHTLCSLAVDFRVTQTINMHRGVHAMVAKSLRGNAT